MAAEAFGGGGILAPRRTPSYFGGACLGQGLRVMYLMTLTIGLYIRLGAPTYLPAVFY